MIRPRITPSTFFHEEETPDYLFLLRQCHGYIPRRGWIVDASGVSPPNTQADTQQRQALDPDRVQQGLQNILLGRSGLYEALRGQGGAAAGSGAGAALRPDA